MLLPPSEVQLDSSSFHLSVPPVFCGLRLDEVAVAQRVDPSCCCRHQKVRHCSCNLPHHGRSFSLCVSGLGLDEVAVAQREDSIALMSPSEGGLAVCS